ncbi:DUF504 domain-containing protein [Geoglobus acetivorans]|uniref:UPF0248 protein GACE_0115 n=1 Tax=Geoglobus acetivorans TaxID=565033 RepID=A0A0A7GE00_GEOAI|nr:hypothetical protein GACE_0115 [Geoglobus acetivorans]
MKKSEIKVILDKFRWHPEYDLRNVLIKYIDRPKGYSVISGEQIREIGHAFIYTESSTIPHHRVIEISYCGKTVWKKLINSGELADRDDGEKQA